MISAVLASNAARRRARNVARGASARDHPTTFRDAPLDWTFATAPLRADDVKAIGAAEREQSARRGKRRENKEKARILAGCRPRATLRFGRNRGGTRDDGGR
jgi:hypothetical protein